MAENTDTTPKTEREEKIAAAARAKALRDRANSTGVGRQINGFMDFVRTQGVVGLAVGLAIGTQANTTVKSIVEGFINPIVSFIIGSPKALTSATWNVIGQDTNFTKYWLTLGHRQLVIGYGVILSSLITLLAVAAVIYFVVKGLKLDKLDNKKEEK